MYTGYFQGNPQPYKFLQRSSSRRSRDNAGKGKFSCDVCGRKCQSQHAMDNHLRVHTGEKPFMCAIEGCGKSFKQKSQQYSHMRGAHQYNTDFLKAKGNSGYLGGGSDVSNMFNHQQQNIYQQQQFQVNNSACGLNQQITQNQYPQENRIQTGGNFFNNLRRESESYFNGHAQSEIQIKNLNDHLKQQVYQMPQIHQMIDYDPEVVSQNRMRNEEHIFNQKKLGYPQRPLKKEHRDEFQKQQELLAQVDSKDNTQSQNSDDLQAVDLGSANNFPYYQEYQKHLQNQSLQKNLNEIFNQQTIPKNKNQFSSDFYNQKFQNPFTTNQNSSFSVMSTAESITPQKGTPLIVNQSSAIQQIPHNSINQFQSNSHQQILAPDQNIPQQIQEIKQLAPNDIRYVNQYEQRLKNLEQIYDKEIAKSGFQPLISFTNGMNQFMSMQPRQPTITMLIIIFIFFQR